MGMLYVGNSTPSLNTCIFNADRTHRYTLERRLVNADTWKARRRILWVMLNPSIADEQTLDPTVAKCLKYSEGWGYTDLAVVNLFSLRATDPKDMKAAYRPDGDPVNTGNIIHQAMKTDTIVLAYGNHGSHQGRAADVLMETLHEIVPDKLHALAINKTGHPAHPLYHLDSLELFPVVVTSQGKLERKDL